MRKILVVIALKEELDAFLETLDLKITSTDNSYYTLAPLYQLNQITVTLLDDQGPEAAATATTKALEAIQPDIAVNIGISGGIGEDVQIGDVTIATSVTNYAFRIQIDDSDQGTALRPATETFRTDPKQKKHIARLEIEQPKLFRTWQRQSQEFSRGANSSSSRELESILTRDPRILAGPVASGPTLVTSKDFARFLLSLNRDFYAVDMEAAGFMKALEMAGTNVSSVVLRGISDLADPSKATTDKIESGLLRRYAMNNATHLLKALLSPKVQGDQKGQNKATHGDHIESIAAMVKNTFLHPRHRRADQEYIDLHSKLIEHFVPKKHWPGRKQQTRLINEIELSLKQSNHATPLRVDGSPGTGKSTLLEVLYIHLRNQQLEGKHWCVPIYIDLHRYDWVQGNPREQAEEDLSPVIDFLEEYPKERIVLLVDGIDEYSPTQSDVERYVFSLVKPDKGIQQIIGVGSPEQPTLEHQTKRRLPLQDPERIITLRPIRTDRGVQLRKFLLSFSKIHAPDDPKKTTVNLLERIGFFKLPTVDILTTSLILNKSRQLNYRRAETFSTFLEYYCQEALARHQAETEEKVELSEIAEIAYKFYIEKGPVPTDIAGNIRWKLMHRHDSIRNFLIGLQSAELLKRHGENKEQDITTIGHVYPHIINKYTKEIMNSSRENQRRIWAGIKRFFSSGDAACKAHACYLAGRIKGKDFQKEAIIFLKEARTKTLKAKKKVLEDLKPPELLLTRTIYISLVALGDKGSSRKYIEHLLTLPSWNNLNRGFHLEYYGDMPYISMTHTDELKPFPKTFEYLKRKILERSLYGERSYPLLDIEIFTLFSLAQHRHQQGRLRERKRIELIELAEQVQAKREIVDSEVARYCNMIATHLADASFRPGKMLKEIYRIKSVKRSGWIKRGIQNPESVADHTLGAFLLGKFLLPERQSIKGYSKSTILEMLLIHDLAEAYTGDLLPEEKSEKKISEEESTMEYISLFGSYAEVEGPHQNIPDQSSTLQRWKEFKSQSTINAQIAKDIDKVEALFQLYSYQEDGQEVQDFSDWEREILKAVQTDQGKEVLGAVMEAFPGIARGQGSSLA